MVPVGVSGVSERCGTTSSRFCLRLRAGLQTNRQTPGPTSMRDPISDPNPYLSLSAVAPLAVRSNGDKCFLRRLYLGSRFTRAEHNRRNVYPGHGNGDFSAFSTPRPANIQTCTIRLKGFAPYVGY